jgi:hypothetical protein
LCGGDVDVFRVDNLFKPGFMEPSSSQVPESWPVRMAVYAADQQAPMMEVVNDGGQADMVVYGTEHAPYFVVVETLDASADSFQYQLAVDRAPVPGAPEVCQSLDEGDACSFEWNDELWEGTCGQEPESGWEPLCVVP